MPHVYACALQLAMLLVMMLRTMPFASLMAGLQFKAALVCANVVSCLASCMQANCSIHETICCSWMLMWRCCISLSYTQPMKFMVREFECFAEPSSLVACDPPQVPTFSDKGLELPDLSTSPEAGHAQADFIYMVRELDLLPYGDTSTNTMTA